MELKSALPKEKILQLVKDLDLSNEYEVPSCDVYVMSAKSSAGNTRLQIVIGLHDETGKLVRVRKSLTLLKDEVSSNKDIKNQCLIIKSVLINELTYKLKEVNYSLFIPTFQDFIQSKRGKLRDTSVDNYEFRGKRIIDYFANYQNITVEQISPKLIIEFIDYLEDKGLSYRTVRDTHALLYSFFNEQIIKEVISVNPCAKTASHISKPQNNVDEFKFLSIEEYEELRDFLETHKDKKYFFLKDMFELTIVYGLRKEEILALQWDCIDFDTMHITIKRTRTKGSKVYDYDNVKNVGSFRVYPITKNIYDILNKIKSQQNEDNLKSNYLFYYSEKQSPEHAGEPYRPDYINKVMQSLIKDYKEEKGIDLSWLTYHKLRHSCVSILIQKGFSLTECQEWLGHSDSETTKKIYIHFKKDWKDKKVNNLDDIWSRHNQV